MSETEMLDPISSLRQMTQILKRVQDVLAAHLSPGGNCDETQAINACLFIVDHKETLAQQRMALSLIAAADRAVRQKEIPGHVLDDIYRLSRERPDYDGAQLQQRLDRIIIECQNETSGADEDKSRDTVLATIIGIAEGRTDG